MIIQKNLSAGNYRTLFIPIVSYVSIGFCGFFKIIHITRKSEDPTYVRSNSWIFCLPLSSVEANTIIQTKIHCKVLCLGLRPIPTPGLDWYGFSMYQSAHTVPHHAGRENGRRGAE